MYSSFLALGVSSLVSTAIAFTPASTNATDLLAANGLDNLIAYEARQVLAGNQSTCTLANAVVRKEWGALSKTERAAYTDAVLCLMSKPGKTDQTVVPGAKTRYDDFVWTHINQTLTIHGTLQTSSVEVIAEISQTNFLSWHRYFVYTYETALRDECGYTGYQPYWNWGKSAFDPVNSPMFDGSNYSMGGNGVYEAHNCTNALPTGLNCIPPGAGGGCVETGPFKNSSAHLGPVAPALAEVGVVSTGTGAAYNPRCIKRDVSAWVSSQWTTDANSTSLITQNPDIYWFQTVMQGDFANGDYGVHAGGHFTIGGDPGGDVYNSPGDPAFWLHHGQIDRTWWIWQNQDIENRQNAISGTITIFNDPPSRNGTLEDLIDLGVNAPGIAIKDVMSTLAGPFCYIYI